MNAFVLIVLFYAWDFRTAPTAAVSMQRFETEAACERARQKIQDLSDGNSRFKTACVSAGSAQ